MNCGVNCGCEDEPSRAYRALASARTQEVLAFPSGVTAKSARWDQKCRSRTTPNRQCHFSAGSGWHKTGNFKVVAAVPVPGHLTVKLRRVRGKCWTHWASTRLLLRAGGTPSLFEHVGICVFYLILVPLAKKKTREVSQKRGPFVGWSVLAGPRLFARLEVLPCVRAF